MRRADDPLGELTLAMQVQEAVALAFPILRQRES